MDFPLYKILLVTPELPPAHCGIAYFSQKVHDALSKICFIKTFVIGGSDDLSNLSRIIEVNKISVVYLIYQSEHVSGASYLSLIKKLKVKYLSMTILISYIPNSNDKKYTLVHKILEQADGIITHGELNLYKKRTLHTRCSTKSF